jgi:ankyrin repeat protein
MKYKQNMVSKTPLHVACEQLSWLNRWSQDEKRQLLELTGDDSSINSQDRDGNTPLHVVCQHNDEDAAVYSGADLGILEWWGCKNNAHKACSNFFKQHLFN